MIRYLLLTVISLFFYSNTIFADVHLADRFNDFIWGREPYRRLDVGDFLLMSTFSIVLIPTTSFLGTTDYSINGINDIIYKAKSDARTYIALNGENYHTAQLELAFPYIKKHYPYATNMQLAQAIAVY